MSLLIILQLCYLVVLSCVRFVDSQSTVNDWSTTCESNNNDGITQCDVFIKLMSLEQRLGETHTKQESLEHQLGEMNTSKQSMEQQLGAMQTSKHSLEQRLEEMNTKQRSLEQQLGEMNTSKQSLEHRLGGMQMKQQSLEQQVVEMKERERRLRKIIHNKQRFVSAQVSRTVADGDVINGIADFKGQLHIGKRHFPNIEIYNISTLSFKRNIPVAGLGCTADMTSCPECDVLFISDECNNSIHVVDERGLTVNWMVNDKPFGLSVNSQLNVLVTFDKTRKLREFTPSGQLVRDITLQSDIYYPYHAIQLDNNRYAVVHGHWDDTGLHRVCIVNSMGTIIQSYGGNRGSGVGQLHTPNRLAVFGGSLIVSDMNNKRLLLFNSSDLTNVQIMMSSIDRTPHRTTLNEDGSKLYLAANTWINGAYVNGHVKVIDLMWN